MVPSTDILIVDDEVGIRELLSEILQDEGYRVSLAENATEARTYRSKQQPALVLLDIWMPDTDGVTLLREPLTITLRGVDRFRMENGRIAELDIVHETTTAYQAALAASTKTEEV